MKRLGFRFDMERCIGCRACQLACKETKQLSSGVYFRRVDECRAAVGTEKKKGPDHFYSGACNHCKDPACVAVCPVGAMYVAADGTVQHNDAVCMGCQRCVLACPYGEVIVHPRTGFAAKCDACAALREKGLPPACVGACPTDALEFGCMEDMMAEAKASGEDGQYTYGGPSFLPDPRETLPSLLVKRVPEALGRDTAEAARAYFEKEEEAAGRGAAAAPGYGADDPNHGAGETSTNGSTEADLLILGGGISAVSAALAAAEKMTEEGKEDFRILICGEESGTAYCRPLLSKGLLKGFSMQPYRAPGKDALLEKHIEYLDNTRALSLDPEKHSVQCEKTGRENGVIERKYRKCIIATGAEAFVPEIPGIKEAEVLTVRKAADTEELRRKTLKADSAIVAGGGFIGLEIAWQLKELGLKITVLEELPGLLGRLVDLSTSELLKERMLQQGMEVMTGVSIARFRKEGEKSVACLTDGSEISADFIVLSTGVRANIMLAAEAGADCSRNIKISNFYETSLPDVYACGDCAEMADGSLKQSWADAVISGRQAGRIVGGLLAGAKNAVPDEEIPDSMMVNIAGTHVLSAGLISEDGDTERIPLYWEDTLPAFRVNEDREREARGVFFFREGRLKGACAIGSLHAVRFIQETVRAGYGKEEFLRMAEEGGMHR